MMHMSKVIFLLDFMKFILSLILHKGSINFDNKRTDSAARQNEAGPSARRVRPVSTNIDDDDSVGSPGQRRVRPFLTNIDDDSVESSSAKRFRPTSPD